MSYTSRIPDTSSLSSGAVPPADVRGISRRLFGGLVGGGALTAVAGPDAAASGTTHPSAAPVQWLCPRKRSGQMPDLPGAITPRGSRASLTRSWNFSRAPSPQL